MTQPVAIFLFNSNVAKFVTTFGLFIPIISGSTLIILSYFGKKYWEKILGWLEHMIFD